MITRVNMRSIEEMARRVPTPQKSRKEIFKRTWMRRWRDNEYLADGCAMIFPLGIVIAAWYFGLIVGASR